MTIRQNPDLARFDWPAVRQRGFLSRVVRRDDATAALRLSRHLTWRPAKLARPRRWLARPGQPARFARPTGGTVKFLGRGLGLARGRDRSRPALARAAGRAPICVWCRWPHQRQPQQPNLAAPLKHRRFATHQDCKVPLKKTSRKRGTISVRALDRWAMIWVRRDLSQRKENPRLFANG